MHDTEIRLIIGVIKGSVRAPTVPGGKSESEN